MRTSHALRALAPVVVLGLGNLLLPGTARAHCDSLDGPVVTAARQALERRDVTPALKWASPGDEAVLREAFGRSLAVRGLGTEARLLADQYFFETLVRLHRQGEGAPYTGLKPAGSVEPGIALADRALETGSVVDLLMKLDLDVEQGVRERFRRALQAKSRADHNVESGRIFVAAYVEFIHHVEGIHRAARGPDPHH